MGTKRVVGCNVFTLLMFLVAATVRADTVVGSGTATFQDWIVRNFKISNLDNNVKPYWDNKSSDVPKDQQKLSNVGFYLSGDSAVPFDWGPEAALPYWGITGKSSKKKGGNADLNFFFQSDGLSNAAILTLETGSASNKDEFGWYDIADPSDKHPIILGPDSPSMNTFTFLPSGLYGFYLKRDGEATFYTESKLNPLNDTLHQHFAVFEDSTIPGVTSYWIGIEDRTRRELKGKEGGLGDYSDLLIRIGPAAVIPEPSTGVLVLSGALLMAAMRHRHRQTQVRVRRRSRLN
jgi:hypothetical protein